MFDSLTDKLQGVFRRLGGRGTITEKDLDAALREVRLALLEADVPYKVVRDFVPGVRERALGRASARAWLPPTPSVSPPWSRSRRWASSLASPYSPCLARARRRSARRGWQRPSAAALPPSSWTP